MMRLEHQQLWRTCGVALLLAFTVAIATSNAAFINLTPTTGANSNDSVPLSDLTSGEVDGIIVGDKIMSGFVYSRIGDMPDASQVNVLGFKDPFGNWGLSFYGTFLDLPGGNFSDAVIRFIVDIDPAFLRQGWRINDAHLFLNGVGVGSPDSGFFVDESFAPDSNEPLNAFVSTFPGGSSQLSDSTIFVPPLERLHVTKDILAIAAANSGQPARATIIDQSFSQTIIPEPATLVLSLAGGMLALSLYRRKR
jgi:hypothetical protein